MTLGEVLTAEEWDVILWSNWEHGIELGVFEKKTQEGYPKKMGFKTMMEDVSLASPSINLQHASYAS